MALTTIEEESISIKIFDTAPKYPFHGVWLKIFVNNNSKKKMPAYVYWLQSNKSLRDLQLKKFSFNVSF